MPLLLCALLEGGPLAQHPSWEADFEDQGVGVPAESRSSQEPKHAQGLMEVTLDVDTTNLYYLIVSEDLRSVRCGYSRQNRRARAERFYYALCILGSPLATTTGRWTWGRARNGTLVFAETPLTDKGPFCYLQNLASGWWA